jgi:hypothetical protein
MSNPYKTENGIDYTLERRRQASLSEGRLYWQGSDGSVLELTQEELAARDTSRSLTDE